MKVYNAIFIVALMALSACKNNNSDGGIYKEEPKVSTSGNMITYPTGYTVKVLGVSRTLVAIDDNDKLTVATLYGGGNKVILKPGTGNTIEMTNLGIYSPLPDGFPPDGNFGGQQGLIDNGTMADTGYVSIKIKGFDKAKTGYNQLNLIIHEIVKARPPGDAGFHTNLAWITYNSKRKNADYSGAFFKSLFTGSISVTEVQEAKPRAQNPYIVEDQVLSNGSFFYNAGELNNIKASSNTFDVFVGKDFLYNYSLGGPFRYQWVNADKGKVTKLDDYSYQLDFPNMLPATDVAVASDTTSKVFLRMAGMNPSVTGFNQLRLFLGKSNYAYQSFLLTTGTKLAKTPTLQEALTMMTPDKLVVSYAAPLVRHY